MTAADVDVIDTMRHFGGSFVQQLAELASRADADNLSRIKTTWADYWSKYEGLARARRTAAAVALAQAAIAKAEGEGPE